MQMAAYWLCYVKERQGKCKQQKVVGVGLGAGGIEKTGWSASDSEKFLRKVICN